MALPRHPGHNDETPVETASTRRTKLLIAIVVVLIAVVVVLHLTGVIPQ